MVSAAEIPSGTSQWRSCLLVGVTAELMRGLREVMQELATSNMIHDRDLLRLLPKAWEGFSVKAGDLQSHGYGWTYDILRLTWLKTIVLPIQENSRVRLWGCQGEENFEA